MALSDYDSLAFNADAQPISGGVTGKDGTSVSIYKTWLYVRNPKMWQPGGRFSEPTIAQIMEGSVSIGSLQIEAIRATSIPNGVFALVTEAYGTPPLMCGIGCYGWNSWTELFLKEQGITVGDKLSVYHGSSSHYEPDRIKGVDWEVVLLGKPKIYKDTTVKGSKTFRLKGDKERKNPHFETVTIVSGGKTVEYVFDSRDFPQYEDKYVGVTPDLMTEFVAWLETKASDYDKVFRDYIEKVKSVDPLRYNQGDQFFADRLGVEIPATPAGEAEIPWMIAGLKSSEKSSD